MRLTSLKNLPLFVLLVSTVAGCAASVPVTKMTPQADTLIAINDRALTDGAKARVSHTGMLEHVEYARYDGDGLTLEAVYDVIIGDRVVLDYHFTIARMLDTWNANASKSMRPGTEKTIQGWHGLIDYQLYTQTATGRPCAGFSGEWDHSARDPFGRPTQLFFGYVCAAKGASLTKDRVEALLKSVRIDQRFGHTFVKVGMRASVDQMAEAVATGRAESGTGNRLFPFNFGTTYSEGDGDSISN